MDNGYIKLFRSMLEWEWYDDWKVTRLFIHLLLKTNWKPKKWHGKEIQAGQLVTTISTLSDETGLTIKQVRTALRKLTETGEITIKGQTDCTLVTIENYAFFQGEENEKGKQRANEGQTENGVFTQSSQKEGKPTVTKRANKGQTKTIENTDVEQGDETEKGKQRASNRANEGQTKGKRGATTKEREEREEREEIRILREKEKEKEKEKVATLSPLFTEPVIEALLAYEEMRHKQKYTTTDRARQIYCNKLIDLASTGGTFDEALAVRIVDKAIEYGWRSFYPLKEDDRSSGKSFLDIDPNTPSDGHSFLDITPEMIDGLPF